MEISREFSYCPQRKSWNKWSKPVFACMTAILGITAAAPAARSQQQQKEVSPPMELSRTVRPWEFLPITGTRAALFGNEAGGMEAWVYPLKIFREFHLHFLTEGRVLSGETLARTLTVRPESATILYAGDTFTVRETLFVPVDAQGAIIVLNVETEQPLEIEAAFHRDFQLEWPAALELEVAMERGLDFERLLGFHIQNNDCALRVHRNEKSLAHGEGVAGVENGRGFRTHGERSGECFAGKNPAFGEEMQMKFAEDLQRIDPRLHPAGFVSEQGRPCPGDGQKFPGAHGARELHRRRHFFLLLLAPGSRGRGGDAQDSRHASKNWF